MKKLYILFEDLQANQSLVKVYAMQIHLIFCFFSSFSMTGQFCDLDCRRLQTSFFSSSPENRCVKKCWKTAEKEGKSFNKRRSELEETVIAFIFSAKHLPWNTCDWDRWWWRVCQPVSWTSMEAYLPEMCEGQSEFRGKGYKVQTY